jgi:hypothetical protein
MPDISARAKDRLLHGLCVPSLSARLSVLVCRFPALRVVVPLFVLSRLALIAATLAGARLRAPSVLSQPTAVPIWYTWDRWDATIYARIAAHGYQAADAHTTPAFFPLFPLAEHLLAPVFHGDPYLAGLLIANIAWLVALLEIHALARTDFGERAAFGAVLALTVFPTAIFGFVPYPESLFLALAAGSLRRIRAHRWLPAALLGMLAALTRQAGLFLILPFLCEVYSARRRSTKDTERPRRTRKKEAERGMTRSSLFRALREKISEPSVLPSLSLSLLIPIGTALYALYLQHALGDPLAFWHVQATWHRATAWPWQTLWLGFRALAAQPSRYFALRAAQELLTVLGMGALGLVCLRRAPRSYAAFALPLYCAFLAQYTPAWPLLSQSRFMLELVPLFIVLGDLIVPSLHPIAACEPCGNPGRRPWRMFTLVALCLPLQLAFIIIFSRAGWLI